MTQVLPAVRAGVPVGPVRRRAARPAATSLRSLWRSSAVGARAALVLVLVAFALSLAGGARAVLYAYPVAAVAVVLTFAVRRRYVAALEVVFWLWLVSPGIRRVVDYRTHYHAASPVLLAAPLAVFVLLPWIVRARRPVFGEARVLVGVAAAVFVYGVLVGALHSSPTGVLADALDLIAPVLLGAFVLGAPVPDRDLRRLLVRVALWGSLLLGAYGLLQFLVLPGWDSRWIIDSGISSAGRPQPLRVRVFGPLNTAGPYGEAMAALLLVSAGARSAPRWLRWSALTFGTIGVGLSLVRAAWIGLLVALVLLMFRRHVKVERLMAAAAVVVVLAIGFGGPVVGSVYDRLNNSVSAGSQDTSFQARLNFQREIAGPVLRNPVGEGLGSTGTGARLGAQDTQASQTAAIIRSVDSGIFETLFTLGSVPGLILLVVTVWTMARLWARSTRRDPLTAFAAAGAVSLLVGMVFTDTYKSIFGVLFWALIGVCGRAARRDSA